MEYSFDRGEFFYDPAEARRESMRRDIEELRRLDAMRERDLPMRIAEEALREVINNPNVRLSSSELQAINDESKMMNGEMKVVSVRRSPRNRPQFSGRNTYDSPGSFRTVPMPRRRKKTKSDRMMSKALKKANARFRTKKGKLRKGKTMRDVMKYAHKLIRLGKV